MEEIEEKIKQYHEEQSNSFVLWTNDVVPLINQWDCWEMGWKDGKEGILF